MRPVETKFSTDFKAKVALAALKSDKTTSELEKEFVVPADQIERWKQHLIDNIFKIFDEDTKGIIPLEGQQAKSNHAKIGELMAENDFLTKVLGRR